MKRRVVGAALALGLSFLVAAPAQAHTGPILYHANDSGYAADFLISCANGSWGVWNNGNSQNTGCYGNISKIYVNPGTQIVCYVPARGDWAVRWDATGWQNFSSTNQTCVYQLD